MTGPFKHQDAEKRGNVRINNTSKNDGEKEQFKLIPKPKKPKPQLNK